ncbi:MAG TPA: hypothetical protein EYH19_01930 [Desulfocapsa sulfexigens]|nr:hypothetical protein [Desulfocapsa sulfexigens]
MERICLLEAGKFLLGIDAAVIIREETVKTFIAEEKGSENVLIYLASFLGQQPPVLLDEKKCGIVVASGEKQLLLVIDRILEEIHAPDDFESFPLLYPELAKSCCPKIFVYKNQVVLLFDTCELDLIYEQLGTSYGRISVDEFQATKESDGISL